MTEPDVAAAGAKPGPRPTPELWSGRVLYPVIAVLSVLTLVGVFGAGPLHRFLSGGQALEGETAPDFSLAVAAGGHGASRVRLSGLRGRVVLLEFWASWCPPCRLQMPVVARAAAELRARPVTVLGINVEAGLDRAVIADTAHEWRADHVQLHDQGEVALAYHVESLPTLVVIGRDGRIVAVHRGAASASEVRALLEGALGQ